jgi:hypothetical protein
MNIQKSNEQILIDGSMKALQTYTPSISCTDIQYYTLLFEKYLADTPRNQLPSKTFEDGKTYYFFVFDSRIRWFTFLEEGEAEMSKTPNKKRSRSVSSKRRSSTTLVKKDDNCEYHAMNNLPAILPQGAVKGYYLLRLHSGKVVLRLMDLHFDLKTYMDNHKKDIETTKKVTAEITQKVEKEVLTESLPELELQQKMMAEERKSKRKSIT